FPSSIPAPPRSPLFPYTTLFRSPVFWNQFIFGQLLHHTLRTGGWFIHFIDSNDQWNFGSFSMVDRFNCLRHDTVVGSYNQYGNIRDLCSARAHACKRSVTWCIKKCDFLSLQFDLIGTNMLCNTTCFSIGHFCVTDRI